MLQKNPLDLGLKVIIVFIGCFVNRNAWRVERSPHFAPRTTLYESIANSTNARSDNLRDLGILLHHANQQLNKF